MGFILAEAAVEIFWYYNGKYIIDFGAHLLDARLDKTASLSIELKVDHVDPNPPEGVARIDYILTFTYSHIIGGKEITTFRGTALGSGARATVA